MRRDIERLTLWAAFLAALYVVSLYLIPVAMRLMAVQQVF